MDNNDGSKDWEKLFEEIDQEFPRTPFTISCVDNIHELDDAVTYTHLKLPKNREV